jgi:hypothetical protein
MKKIPYVTTIFYVFILAFENHSKVFVGFLPKRMGQLLMLGSVPDSSSDIDLTSDTSVFLSMPQG